jgi:acetyltransferase-like isoleucine patch superfamily enzyme
MNKLISAEIDKLASQLGLPRSHWRVRLALLGRLVELGINFLLSRWRLRGASHLGQIVFTKGRPKIINRGELRIGHVTRIWSNVNQVRLAVGRGATLHIGDHCRLNGPTISVTNRVIIGNHCRIAPHVIIMDSDFHDVTDRQAEGKGGEIIIKDGAWVATRAMVLKGVTIGKRAVVAAGAVVTKDVPDYAVVAGVPAKVIRYLEVDDSPEIAAPTAAAPQQTAAVPST